MLKSTHPNSKTIKVFPLMSLSQSIQSDPEAKEYLELAQIAFGSFYESINSHKIATGLESWEERILLPDIIKTDTEDRDFLKKVEIFYVDLNIKTPFSGITLEIGLEEDNDKPIRFKNEKDEWVLNKPLNSFDYLKYRLMKSSYQVAPNKAEGLGNPSTKRWYFDDAEVNKKEEVAASNLKDKALTYYLEVKDNNKRVTMILTLLNEDPKGLDVEKRSMRLRGIAEAKPAKFISVYENKDIEYEYEIRRMVSTGVLESVGDAPRYLIKESGVEIGNGVKDTILWIKDKANSSTYLKLKAELQSVMKPV